MAKTYTIKLASTEIDKYLKSPFGFKLEPNKLWTEASRNLDGELKATFVGIFPKIQLNFRAMTESELKTVLALLSPASISVTYWDTESATYKTADFYAGDFSYPYFNNDLGLYGDFSVNLIAYKKRT